MRSAIVSVALLALLVASAGAAVPPVARLDPPSPELARLVPYVAAPIEKPPAEAPELPVPAPPADLPALPPAPIVVPPEARPAAFLAPPGTLPCVGAWLGIASKALECGRARFARGGGDPAAGARRGGARGGGGGGGGAPRAGARARAARVGGERELVTEARYWLGETYYHLGRIEQADWLFRQVVQTSAPGGDWLPLGPPAGGRAGAP